MLLRGPAPSRRVADTERLDIERVRIYRRHRFSREDDIRDVSVVLRTAQGSPLAVEKTFDRGRVIVQTVPLGVQWSNLPLCQASKPCRSGKLFPRYLV